MLMPRLAVLWLWLQCAWAAYSLEVQLAATPVCGNDLCQFFVLRDSSDAVVVAASVVALLAPGPLFVNGSTSSAPRTASCGSFVSIGQIVKADPDCTGTDPGFVLNATTFRGGWFCLADPSSRPNDVRLFLVQLSVPAGTQVDLTLSVVHGNGMETAVRAVCNAPPTVVPTTNPDVNATTLPVVPASDAPLIAGLVVGLLIFALLVILGVVLFARCKGKKVRSGVEPASPGGFGATAEPGSPQPQYDSDDLL
jgi:hypothetical protein